MAGNTSLNNASKAKKDEFYTRLTDIEKELRYYRKHFEGKTVFCNCDDPFESNFFKYFALNFNKLGLKKLIATCYAGSPISGQQLSLFDVLGGEEKNRNKPYKAVVTSVYDAMGDGGVDMLDVAELFKNGKNELTELEGDGDFRSRECLDLMDEADIVVTNPPFSEFRSYVATLMTHEKKFVIIGSQNAVKYKEIFPLFMTNRLWLGYNNGDMAFKVPDSYRPHETRFWVDETGQKWRSMGNICWFTNLDIKKRHEEMILVKRYDPDEYPSYVNYDGIEVSKTADIPCDYAGNMGVPITFMNIYNPDQFEIVGLGHGNLGVEMGVRPYDRSLKPLNKGLRDGDPFYLDGKGYPFVPYTRVFIRNLHPEAPMSRA